MMIKKRKKGLVVLLVYAIWLFVSLLLCTYGPIDATLAMLLVHPPPAPEHVFDSVLVCVNVALRYQLRQQLLLPGLLPR